MPMPAPGSIIHSKTPTMDRRHTSPEAIRRDSRGPNDIVPSPSEGQSAGTAVADPMVAYARRSSMFLPSRTSSTYSVYRVPSGTDPGLSGSSIAFPTTTAPEYVVPARARAASSFGHGTAVMEDRRRLLRTLSTVSIHESGEGHAGGLADIAPIGKFIVEQDRTEDEAVQSEMPKELVEGPTPDDQAARKKSGDEKRRLFMVG